MTMENWWHKGVCVYCDRSKARDGEWPIRGANGAAYCSERCKRLGERRAEGRTIVEPSPIHRCGRIRGVWEGVRIPRSVAVYDVRDPIGDEGGSVVRGADGSVLWSSDRALVAHGLPKYGPTGHHVSGRDYRDPVNLETALRRERRHLAQAWREWRRARRWYGVQHGLGGSVVMRPALVSIGNYGYSLHGDATATVPYEGR